MVDAAASVEWIVASGEVDALMLEFNLIQQYKPRFNIRYRDDKSYPYLALTVGEKWPRAQVLRGTKRKKVRYFGPYGHAWAIRDTLDAMTRVFPIRTCTNHFFDQRARAGRPCLYYDIGRCSGPCVPAQTGITEEAYRRDVDALGDFLAGNSKPVLKRLDAQMAEASEREEYEQAARYRDQLQAARRALESQEMVLVRPEDLDVVGLAEDDLEAAFQVFTVRGGRVLGTEGLGRRSRRGPRPTRARGVVPPPGLHGARGRAAAHPRADGARRSPGPRNLAVPAPRLRRHDRGSGTGRQAEADGSGREQCRGRLPSTQAPPRLGLRGAFARALGARRAARTGAGAAPDRVLRHLEPGPERHRGVHGRLRRRPAEALGLSTVRDQECRRTGRFRQHAGDADQTVLTAPPGEGRGARRPQAILVPAGARRRRRRPRAAERRHEGPRGPRTPHPPRRVWRNGSRRSTSPTDRIRCRSRGGRRRSSSSSTSATRHTGSRSPTTDSGAIAARSPRRSTRSRASGRRGSGR